MLATLQCQLCLSLASCALQSQDNLLCRLSLLVEDRLGLTTITGLLSVVTTLSLREQRCLGWSDASPSSICDCSYLSSLVLGNLVLCVLSAILALAVGTSCLRNVDLQSIEY